MFNYVVFASETVLLGKEKGVVKGACITTVKLFDTILYRDTLNCNKGNDMPSFIP